MGCGPTYIRLHQSLFTWRSPGRVLLAGVGWALDRTLALGADRGAAAGIAQTTAATRSGASSDRGVQYACGDYAQVLQRHR